MNYYNIFKDSFLGKKCSICKDKRTSNENGICNKCQLEEDMKAETKLKCPSCQSTMDKEIQSGVIFDVCSKCKGVFLEQDELEKLFKAERDSVSCPKNFGAGFIIGSAT